MTQILVINASPNVDVSASRKLTDRFVQTWLDSEPGARITYRDVGVTPPPHIDQTTINAYYTPVDSLTAEQHGILALSDQIVSEVEEADIVVIGSPMHNFGISSGLKTWVDHLARVGRTFRYTENGPEGLLGGRRVFVLTARGGVYTDSKMDSQEPYLRTVLGFVGLDDVTFIHAEGMSRGREGLEIAERKIGEIVPALSAVEARI